MLTKLRQQHTIVALEVIMNYCFTHDEKYFGLCSSAVSKIKLQVTFDPNLYICIISVATYSYNGLPDKL